MRPQAASAVAALMTYLLALLAVGGLQQQVLVGLAVHAELVPRLWFSFLQVRPLHALDISFCVRENSRFHTVEQRHRSDVQVCNSARRRQVTLGVV